MSDKLDLKKHIRDVEDFPIPGIKFRDITSLIETPEPFRKTCKELTKMTDVIIDDLVATGGTAIACAELLTENFNVEKSDILILCIIDLPELGGSKLIREQGYNIETLVSY